MEITNKLIKRPKSQVTSVTDNVIQNSWKMCIGLESGGQRSRSQQAIEVVKAWT